MAKHVTVARDVFSVEKESDFEKYSPKITVYGNKIMRRRKRSKDLAVAILNTI